MRTLSELLNAEDGETGWFAAMLVPPQQPASLLLFSHNVRRMFFFRTLRTLASQQKGCLRLRDHPSVLDALHVSPVCFLYFLSTHATCYNVIAR